MTGSLEASPPAGEGVTADVADFLEDEAMEAAGAARIREYGMADEAVDCGQH